jgi:hypothetical protein
MSDTPEPPKNPLIQLWERIPENLRLPIILAVPALIVVAATPLLFREGSAKKRTVALETTREAATNANGVFLSRDQPAASAPAPVAPVEPSAPTPPSSLMRPVDAAQYAGPPLPGQTAPPAEAPAEKEGGLEESGGADVDSGGGAAGGPVDMAAMMQAAGGGDKPQRLAARSSEFSYSGGVGAGAYSSAGMKKLQGFGSKKKKGLGSAPPPPASLQSQMAAAGLSGSSAEKTALEKVDRSGAGSILAGLGMGGAGGGAAGGSGQGGPSGGDSSSVIADVTAEANDAMDSAKKCQEANRIYTPQITAATNELTAINKKRFNTLDCRNIKCGDIIPYCGLVNKCECPDLACRSISKCQQINRLNCDFSRMCPAAGRPCGGASCR